MTVLGEIALFTNDVEGTSAFYRDLIDAEPSLRMAGPAHFSR